LGFQEPARIVHWLLLSFGADTLLRCGPRAACPRSSGFGWLGACRHVDGTIAAFKAPGGAQLLEGFAYLRLAALEAVDELRRLGGRGSTAPQFAPNALRCRRRFRRLNGDAAHRNIKEQPDSRKKHQPEPDRLQILELRQSLPENIPGKFAPNSARAGILWICRFGQQLLRKGLAAGHFAKPLHPGGVAFQIGKLRGVWNR